MAGLPTPTQILERRFKDATDEKLRLLDSIAKFKDLLVKAPEELQTAEGIRDAAIAEKKKLEEELLEKTQKLESQQELLLEEEAIRKKGNAEKKRLDSRMKKLQTLKADIKRQKNLNKDLDKAGLALFKKRVDEHTDTSDDSEADESYWSATA